MAHWIFYPYTATSGDPGSVLLDHDAATGVRPRDFRDRAVLSVPLRRPTSDGLTSSDESKVLYAIEDDVVPLVCASGRSLFVGRTTASGRRDFYFYTGEPEALKATIEAAMTRYSAYAYELTVAPDPGWSSFFDVLRPSPAQMNLIMNREVLENLAKQGDDGTAPRAIDHLAKRLGAHAKDVLISIVEGDGFTILSTEPDGDAVSVAFTRVDRADDIDAVTGPLFALCERLGADYDGWGCVATPA